MRQSSPLASPYFATFWKHMPFHIFHKAHKAAELIILINTNLFLHNHVAPIFSKLPPTSVPATCEIMFHILVATTWSKKKWLHDSFSSQNIHVLSFTSLLFSRSSLVRTLFVHNSQRRKCTLGGTFKFQFSFHPHKLICDTETSHFPGSCTLNWQLCLNRVLLILWQVASGGGGLQAAGSRWLLTVGVACILAPSAPSVVHWMVGWEVPTRLLRRRIK